MDLLILRAGQPAEELPATHVTVSKRNAWPVHARGAIEWQKEMRMEKTM